ncbi:NAD(P)/FAD-dependent oxidoreductase [Pediococcus claussenii]|uniref:FAD dependent oxidoreductase family protein n=1 Tax=Pediococcus claussenii (strain ATCC BAA-344 / DSM 14800 / JCM 18046 / KCTC 3811 / LMG 21948 / P06) TaxID=701521 RepID=G8PDE5_PEDCP|nr:FAD-dependent oxidoreductase [Pediococcus claussenii]AEV95280.1 FAD dependent oxidoreductase family protein [Pediococcus claussenii ATCC BAA-344]ANZ68815.1 hypothetical protein AYR57_00100 [Pediococcus claussenii]ANZ70631.1 hypothetical protein AYR58_00100 [Pediococcus claussenii]KRN19538.1 hypothetical protein IV79_GL001255 [Pediococcus claussenii]
MKIAVIGDGIVGATVGFYLSKEKKHTITMFDYGIGQATKASAGIIAPWLSKRRSKVWYHLARDGASVINELATETGMTTDVYDQSGVIYLRKNDSDLQNLNQLGIERRKEAPLMGELNKLSSQSIQNLFPGFKIMDQGLYVSGGAKIDGAKFVEFLNKKSTFNDFIKEPVKLTLSSNRAVMVNNQRFDCIVLAVGAWLPDILKELGYKVKVRPQKGQLIEVKMNPKLDQHLPVLMPEGERDFIPQNNGGLIIGATHENDGGFDLKVSDQVKSDLLASGQRIITSLTNADIVNYRVGTRAYTNDFLPFFGSLTDGSNLLVASGLGSSGLTTGPLIGKLLSEIIEHKSVNLSYYTHSVSDYISLDD